MSVKHNLDQADCLEKGEQHSEKAECGTMNSVSLLH